MNQPDPHQPDSHQPDSRPPGPRPADPRPARSLESEAEQRFSADEAQGTPLMASVQQLAQDTGRSVEAMELLTCRELGELAERTYGEGLPEFWRVWVDWHRPQRLPPTGDL